MDIHPATAALATVVQGVRDDQLASSTPSDGLSLAALLDHVDGLAEAFAACARKEVPPGGSQAPAPSATHLAPDWRTIIPAKLDDLASAWNDSNAWKGTSEVGGVESSAEQLGMFGLNEVIVHGWEIAAASGQALEVDPVLLRADYDFIEALVASNPEGTPGLFAAPVGIPSDQPLLNKLIALTGRNPGWHPT